MALAYIDDTGIHLPDYPTVLDHVKGIMHDIYGDVSILKRTVRTDSSAPRSLQ